VFLDLTGDGYPAAAATAARSHTEIRFSCNEPGASSFADLEAVAVLDITLNGRSLDPGLVADGRLRLSDLAANNTLIVTATIGVSTSGSGLTQYTDPADGGRYVLVNCYPTAARRVFCCFDQPDLRAAVSLTVAAPVGWTCVANGEVDHRPVEGEAGIWRFSTVDSMKPYEFTLCGGPYVTVPSARPATGPPTRPAAEPRLTVRCRPCLSSSPGLARIADLVSRVVAYYEQYLGVPCPYRKLDVVFAPELGPVAMEDPAVMYVSEPLLQRAADPADDHVAIVLAHETAHLWFGCLVEGGWWDDLWIAEAMASFLSYEAATAILGQPDAWAEFAMTGEIAAYQADNLPSRLPVSSPVHTAADALTRPVSITYSKGTAVLRQLAALIGPGALRASLRDYLSRYAWSASTLSDLIGSWSAAAGRDLTPWAAQWLQQPGVNTVRPEITMSPDGVITSLAIAQGAPTGAAGPLRTHQLTIGLYQLAGSRLRCAWRIGAAISGEWTHIPELTGTRMPAAILLNDADQAFAMTRFDRVSWRVLIGAAMDVSDPVAEAVCWTATWDMVLAAELDAAEFAALVARRLTAGGPAAGLEQLLDNAVTGADYYATADRRAAARQHLAAAALAAAENAAAERARARPAVGQPTAGYPADAEQVAAHLAQSAARRLKLLARGYATSADSPAQLDLLRRWLGGRLLPAGVDLDLELRARILTNLAARDLATDADLAAYAADDPASADTQTATLLALRPRLDAKEAAWSAALAPGQSPRLARAYATGFWVPGQEELLAPFRERYFAEALPAVRQHDNRTAQRLARALYPLTLADQATLAATDAVLARTASADPVRPILLEQRTLLGRMITAQSMGADLLGL